MRKSNIICFIAGAMLFGTVGVFAGQYTATENPFTVQLNGSDVNIEGYNINDSTYFKLRDIASVVGGFDVGFSNNTIQLSKDGYVYDNTSAKSSDDVLRDYAKENIWQITNEDTNTMYGDVRFMLTDVTGDDKNDLLAVALGEDGQIITQMEVYVEENGFVTKILNEQCLGYNGGCVYPVRYNGEIYVCAESFSSGTGFLKNLLKYENGEWGTAYSCHTVYDWGTGAVAGYDVNGSMVSESEYNKMVDDIAAGVLQPNDFVNSDNL